jgi:glutamate synthase (NADPH/NADH) large chain
MERNFVDRYNHELIDIHRLAPANMEMQRDFLLELLQTHARETGSPWGARLVEDFSAFVGDFWLVKPKATDLATLMDTLRRAA